MPPSLQDTFAFEVISDGPEVRFLVQGVSRYKVRRDRNNIHISVTLSDVERMEQPKHLAPSVSPVEVQEEEGNERSQTPMYRAVIAALHTIGKPCTRNEIFRQMQADKFPFTALNPSNALGSYLAQNGFTRAKKIGNKIVLWWMPESEKQDADATSEAP